MAFIASLAVGLLRYNYFDENKKAGRKTLLKCLMTLIP